jgi:hypothetical protein
MPWLFPCFPFASQKDLSTMKSLPLGGISYTPTTLQTFIQSRIDAANEVITAGALAGAGGGARHRAHGAGERHAGQRTGAGDDPRGGCGRAGGRAGGGEELTRTARPLA